MCPNGKARSSKRRRQTRKWVIAVAAVALILVLLTVAYLNNLKGSNTGNPTQTAAPAGFDDFTAHYLQLMHNLNSTQTRQQMAQQLNPSWNQTDLFAWETSKLTFIQSQNWYEDPFQILNDGKGICVQWSIVYVSACLALGYQSRFVVAVDTANWQFIHTWAEDYYNGSWVHVDPSDRVWNDPSRYQGPTWTWGQYIGGEVRIYAFQDGTYQDVTATYAAH